MGGDFDRADARDEDRHQGKGAHFEKGRHADRHAKAQMFGDRLSVRSEQPLRAHLVIVRVAQEEGEVDERRGRVQECRGYAHPCATKFRQSEQAVHEQGVHRNLERKRSERNPHGDLRTAHGGVQRNEHAAREGARQPESARNEDDFGEFLHLAGCAAKPRPDPGVQHDRHADDGEQDGDPAALHRVKADALVVACAEVIAGDRRERLQDAHEADEDCCAGGSAQGNRRQVLDAEPPGHDGVNGDGPHHGQIGDEDRTGKARKPREPDVGQGQAAAACTG